jgi:hypothetical protein
VQMFSLPCTEVACPCLSEWNERAVTRTAEGRGDGVIGPFPVASPIDYAVNVNPNGGLIHWPTAAFVNDGAAGLEHGDAGLIWRGHNATLDPLRVLNDTSVPLRPCV